MGDPPDRSATGKCKNNGLFHYRKTYRRKELVDGAGVTFLGGEATRAHVNGTVNVWSYSTVNRSSLRSTANPLNYLYDQGPHDQAYGSSNPAASNGAFRSDHIDGGNFVFADGHVSYLTDNIDKRTYQALSTKKASSNEGAVQIPY